MSQWPDLASLELFVSVADHGSLGAGARAVGMAQPNASRSLTRLERQFGTPLVVRSARGSTLTPAGVVLARHSRQVLSAAQNLRDAARALRGAAPRALVVAASQTIAEHLMPAWLAALRSARPDAAVELHVHNSHDVVEHVREGRAGLGFIEDPRAPGDVRSVVVGGDEMVLVVAPHHVWAARTGAVRADELVQTPLITREAGSGTRVALDEALGRPVQPYLELPSNAAVRVAVASGAAPAVLSRLAVSDALAAGTLVQVPLAFKVRRPLHAVWVGARRLSGVAADMVTIAVRAVGAT